MDKSTLTASTETLTNDVPNTRKGWRFTLVLIALCISLFVSALDAMAVSTALPTIVSDLHGSGFIWIANGYSIGAGSVMPWAGSLSNIFGRKPVLLVSLSLFMLGSGLAMGASSMGMLIAARVVQGMGSGGVITLSEVVVADLVPLKERGPYLGMLQAIWGIAAATGPPFGGVFSEKVSWRWLFGMNLPIIGAAIILVFFFLNLPIPQDSFREKIKRIDWLGNILIISGLTTGVVGLCWGGSTYPWTSPQVLVTVILGFGTLIGSFVYQAKVPEEPTIPMALLSNRTSVAGYVTTAFLGMMLDIIIYFAPTYFQACKMASPLQSAVYTLPLTLTVSPAAILTGVSLLFLKVFRPQNIIGWVFLLVGVSTWSLWSYDAGPAYYTGLQVISALGVGMLLPATNVASIAHLPPELNAQALALQVFVRELAVTIGLTIGGTILQNSLSARIPSTLLEQVGLNASSKADLLYSAIPMIPQIPIESIQILVRDAFAESLKKVWLTGSVIAAFGLLASLFIQEKEMSGEVDAKWTMQGEKERASEVTLARTLSHEEEEKLNIVEGQEEHKSGIAVKVSQVV